MRDLVALRNSFLGRRAVTARSANAALLGFDPRIARDVMSDQSPKSADLLKILQQFFPDRPTPILRTPYGSSAVPQALPASQLRAPPLQPPRRGRRKHDGELKIDEASVAFMVELYQQGFGLSECARRALEKFPACRTTTDETTLARLRRKCRDALKELGLYRL